MVVILVEVEVEVEADPTIADIRSKNYIAAKTTQNQRPLSVGNVPRLCEIIFRR
jgi:hypothetical protein